MASSSREPTHWMEAMRFGSLPSDGRWTWPWYGPLAESTRSNWRLLMTFGYWPNPYSARSVWSQSSKPGAITTAPTSRSTSSSCWS